MEKRYVPVRMFVIISFAMIFGVTLFLFAPVMEEVVWGMLPPLGQLIVGIFILAVFCVVQLSRRRTLIEKVRTARRPRCPFYGFSRHSVIMADNEGNQCALARTGTPCALEAAGRAVDWEKCEKFNTQDNSFAISHILDSTHVFPKELRPRRRTPWSGIGARRWYDLVMKAAS